MRSCCIECATDSPTCSSTDPALPVELRGAPATDAEGWACRLLALFGAAHASEEYVPSDGFAFADCLRSIDVAGRELRCLLDWPATSFTRQWFFGAVGMTARFRCTPVTGGVVGVGILPHHQRPASGEHLLGTAGFPGSVGCLVLGRDVWVMSGGTVLHRWRPPGSPLSNTDLHRPIHFAVTIVDRKVIFVVDNDRVGDGLARVRCEVPLPHGVEQFRLGVSMNRVGQRARFLSCSPYGRTDCTFRNCCPDGVVKMSGDDGPQARFECRESMDGTLHSHQTFLGTGDSVALKVAVTGWESGEAVGIGALRATAIDACTFRSLGDTDLEQSFGLLLHQGELILRQVDHDFVVELPAGVSLSSTIELGLRYSDCRLVCAVQGTKLQLPSRLVSRLRLNNDRTYRLGITVSGAGQKVEVLSSCIPLTNEPEGFSAARRLHDPGNVASGHHDHDQDGRGPNIDFSRCYVEGAPNQEDGAEARDCWPVGYLRVLPPPLQCRRYKYADISGTMRCSAGSWSVDKRFMARLHDACLDVTGVRLVTVYDRGQSLSEVIRQWRSEEVHVRLQLSKLWIGQLLRGVRALEAVGLAHGDLRPENITLTRGNGFKQEARIVDFGLLRPVGSGDTTDVYAVGCIAFELVTRRKYDCRHAFDWRGIEAAVSERDRMEGREQKGSTTTDFILFERFVEGLLLGAHGRRRSAAELLECDEWLRTPAPPVPFRRRWVMEVPLDWST